MRHELFHGSRSIVQTPDLSMSRMDIDFGQGFYLSPNYKTSAKWTCRTATSICNKYEISFEGLTVYKFGLNQEWLDYVVRNRKEQVDTPSVFDEYDVLIGAIADDRLFHTVEMYEDGFISAENAVKVLDCMDYGLQYVLKTEKAVNNLVYKGYVKIAGEEKEQLKKQYKDDYQESLERTEHLLKQINRG